MPVIFYQVLLESICFFYGISIAKLTKEFVDILCCAESPCFVGFTCATVRSRQARIATAGSKEARDLARVKNDFERIYREYSAGENTTESGTQHSFIGINKDGIEVYETSQDVMNLTWDERKAQYLDVMKNEYSGRTARFERNGHVYYAKFDQSSIRKPIYGDSRSSKAGVKALIKAGADGDVFDLVENSQYTRSKPNTKTHTNADYFDYFIKTVQIDGKVFDLVADVEKEYGVEDGYVYTLALEENKKIKASPAHGSPNAVPVKGAGNASGNTVAQNNPNVNSQHSFSKNNILFLRTARARNSPLNSRTISKTPRCVTITAISWLCITDRKMQDSILSMPKCPMMIFLSSL